MSDQDWHAAIHATEKANSLRPDVENAIRELIAAAHWSATIWTERADKSTLNDGGYGHDCEQRAAELKAVAEEIMVDWTKLQQHAAQVWGLANGRPMGDETHGHDE